MRSKVKTVEMCTGPLFKNIWRFAVPILLTALIQRLYNTADVLVVGRYAGQEALAGVGTTGSLTALILDLFLGLSAGVSVVLGRALGAKNNEDIHKITHTAICLSVVGGVVISIFGIVFANPLLRLIDVPENVMPQAQIYMQICFAGKLPALLYNFGAAILRAKGDAKRPLFIVLISGIINVILNLFFVICLGMKADGVALATVISQIYTAVSILWILARETDATCLYFKKIRMYKAMVWDIIKIGVPSGVQGMIFSFSNVILQSTVNGFGSAAIAGSAAAANIGGYYYMIQNSFFHAALAFTSQNVGAGQYKRVRKVLSYCLIDVGIAWALEAIFTLFSAEGMISLFVPGDAEAIFYGTSRHLVIGCTYGLCGIMEVLSGVNRGMGYSMSSLLISVIGVCGIRILWIFTVFPQIGTFSSLFASMPLSWIGTIAGHFVFYLYVMQKKMRENGYFVPSGETVEG